MSDHWAIVLAGGEGNRIRDLTRDPTGIAVPKQFCCFRDGRSLLRRALDRASAWSDWTRIVPVVMAHHRIWWEPELADLPCENVVQQTENRGTAVAIWRAVLRIAGRDPDALVLILPSDHDVDQEMALWATITAARDAAREWPDHLILIGMEAEEADPGYGWIVPTATASRTTHGVVSFVEKPDRAEAVHLRERGALINSFLLVARARALEQVMRLGLPELELGPGAPNRDFGHDLLPRAARRLRVLPAKPCGWADLGTPQRLRRWFERHEEAFVWRRDPERATGGRGVPTRSAAT